MIADTARLHFVGIGGTGMSALAHILLQRGHRVSGCDCRESEATARIRGLGGTVLIGHNPNHLDETDVVVVSRAIARENAEVLEARRRGLSTLHRAEVLADVLAQGRGIAVVGTHGKTTTTAMLTRVLTAAGYDPTALIGADVAELGGNARVGNSPWIVAEVDESDGSLVHVRPFGVVLTSLDGSDHRDFYSSAAHLEQTFDRFLQGATVDGFVAACIDHPRVQALCARLGRRIVTYGFVPTAAVRGVVQATHGPVTRTALIVDGRAAGVLTLQVPGRHNVANALGAVAAALQIGISLPAALDALAEYRGASRRFEMRGEADGVLIVDDYAHNPVKVEAVLRAAREGWPDRRLIVLFQPHRYTRTRTTHAEFARVFDVADELVVTEIYAAGEAALPGVSAQLIIDAVALHRSVHSRPAMEDALDLVERLATPGSMVLTLGAGDIGRAAALLLQRLARRAAADAGRGPAAVGGPA